MSKFVVEVGKDLPEEIVQYILDCWVTFVTQDLGYNVSDLLMLYEEDTLAAVPAV